jgi:hypothetical protein
MAVIRKKVFPSCDIANFLKTHRSGILYDGGLSVIT